MSSQSVTHPVSERSSTLLRTALLLDGEYCLGLGLVLALFALPIATWAGDLPWLWIEVLGIGLALYGGGLLWMMRGRSELTGLAKIVIGLNVAWIVASVIAFLAGWFTLTSGGMWAAAIIDDIVLVLAIVQYIGLRRAG